MRYSLLKVFSKYFSVGILNTALHWLVFYLLNSTTAIGQAWSNLTAFAVAVTFSFFVNARYTFKATATTTRYLAFVSFMTVISFMTGWIADLYNSPPIFTLIVFSGISLILGFIYSRYIVFREKANE